MAIGRARQFLDDKVVVYSGDSRDVLATLPEASVDAIVCDPPYALVSGNARYDFANTGAGNPRQDKRPSGPKGGFMGKQWDTGETAFAVEFWQQALRVLKPGGHLVAFSGTRTYHRMACAIEDAGFEIRDQLAWVYGSGFPKSLDVSKAIDKHGGQSVAWFGPWFRKWRQDNGITQKQVAALFPSKTGSLTGCVANWELGLNMPTPEQFNRIRDEYGLPFKSLAAAEREVVGCGRSGAADIAFARNEAGDYDITAPSTEAAKQWSGFGTALKPSWEPICLARKPLIGTVAANVLQHGTGALNIDGCRIETDDIREKDSIRLAHDEFGTFVEKGGGARTTGSGAVHSLGRWPANLIHDGSDEVIAGFPESDGNSNKQLLSLAGKTDVAYGEYAERSVGGMGRNDTGSAARFFYTAKADAEDRLGSKHPTVKPVDLMQWLVRLVCPRGGLVLDPFAGTGTTGEAAWREGMRAILIEREAEYFADIARRMELATMPTKRAAVAKTKNNLDKPEDLPLFSVGS